MNQWMPINDYPGDQLLDLTPTENESFWGEIGMAGNPEGSQWSWTIMATDDYGNQWEAAHGVVSTEAEAKRTVEMWRP